MTAATLSTPDIAEVITSAVHWRPIAGTDWYEVSDTGLVRSIDHRDSLGRFKKGTLLRQALNKNGYPAVTIYRSGKPYTRPVHRHVLENFIGPCPDGMECLHKNGVRDDNRLENLRWGTHTENIREMVAAGNFVPPMSKRTHCVNGHEFTPKNTYSPPGRPKRVCRTCLAERRTKRKTRAA